MDSFNTNRGPLTRTGDGYVAGVADGLGRYFDIDATLIRIGWLVAVIFFGTGILLYLGLWWLMPREGDVPVEPTQWERDELGRYAPPLRRTSNDRKILGVCGGLARRWQIDPVFVRLGVAALAMASGGLVILAYLAAAVVIPNSHGSSVYSRRAHPVEF